MDPSRVHEVTGLLLSWATPQDTAYQHLVDLSWSFLLNRVPVAQNGLPYYYLYSSLDLPDLAGRDWPNNPASTFAMLTESALDYYPYSGDAGVLTFASQLLNYMLANGLTPSDWSWASVPFASADPGATTYSGATDTNFGPGSGRGW